MKRNKYKLVLLLIWIGLATYSLPILANNLPRLFMWGMGGSETIGRADFLAPLVSNACNSLLYADLQGQIGNDNAKYYGVGLGYRGINQNGLFGGYLFYDQNYSKEQNSYSFINPGIEFKRPSWEIRANGYVPVSHRKNNGRPFQEADTCGVNLNTNQLVFAGHDEFIHRYHTFEEVGPGADAEVGVHLPHGRGVSLYAGTYYYQFQDAENVKGAEARAVIHLTPALALTIEASYDNQQHAAIVAGLRVQFRHTVQRPMLTLSERLYDPIIRKVGNLKTGGVPIVRGIKNDGLSLYRDNIFFFTSSGGTSFGGASTGTYENPLAADQFTQSNVNSIAAIAQNANLFFNSGTYAIDSTSPSAPNANISLVTGQSIYGRTADFKSSAIGSARPTLLGSLAFTGNDILDSTIVADAMTSSGSTNVNFNTLSIQNAPNILICNSQINANLNITGNNNSVLQVGAIYANNSQVQINSSVINAKTTIAANDNFISMITGIGGNTAGCNSNVANSTVKINNTTLNSQGIVQGSITNGVSGTGVNYVTNIGGNTYAGSTNFQNNVFILNSSILNSTGAVGQSMGGSAVNYVSNIGGNNNSEPGAGSTTFQNNQFILVDSSLNSTASIAQNIADSGNLATNIGGNALVGSGTQNANFNSNDFTISFSNLSSIATIGGQENGQNINAATVIGGNQIVGTANFNQNTFNINFSNLNSTARVAELTTGSSANMNSATVIGGNAFGGDASFNDNNFAVTGSSLNSLTTINTDNTNSSNFSTVVGGNAAAGGNVDFASNVLQINTSSLASSASIGTSNSGLDFATGIGGNANVGSSANFITNLLNSSNSAVNVLANVIGNNTGTNQATGWQAVSGIVNLFFDQFSITAIKGSGTPSVATAKIPGTATTNDVTTTYTVT